MSSVPLMAVDQAVRQLLAQASAAPALAVDDVCLSHADGRILARDLAAIADSPAWANSAMDGYALRLADLADAPLPVSQTLLAGMSAQPLQAGSCARIFTGAPVPDGADCVQMQENCEVMADGRVRFAAPLRAGLNIRRQGDEISVGAPLLAAGSLLNPMALGVLAAQGFERVPVLRKPRVALLSTGNELVEAGTPLAAGQIRDSNRIVLGALLRRMGCEVLDLGSVRDDTHCLQAALERAAQADLIISSGGVSVGDADCIGPLLRASGEVQLWKLAIKPGKPFTFAQFNGVAFLGLPGNPGAALVTFLLLARPYILQRLGATQVEPMRLAVPAGFDWPKAGRRQEYLRVRLVDGRAQLQPNQSSGTLLSAATADGLLEVPAGRTFVAGESVDFIAFAGLF